MPTSYLFCLVLASSLSLRGKNIKISKENMTVILPGTHSTLVILILFFITKYVLGYISATDPIFYQKIQIFEIVVCGTFSGYFFGKAMKYLSLYLQEPKA